MVEVWQVIDGHVADKGAANFVIAGAAVQPADEEEELNTRGECDDDPGDVHGAWRKFRISNFEFGFHR